jgi:hypothetical protein
MNISYHIMRSAKKSIHKLSQPTGISCKSITVQKTPEVLHKQGNFSPWTEKSDMIGYTYDMRIYLGKEAQTANDNLTVANALWGILSGGGWKQLDIRFLWTISSGPLLIWLCRYYKNQGWGSLSVQQFSTGWMIQDSIPSGGEGFSLYQIPFTPAPGPIQPLPMGTRALSGDRAPEVWGWPPTSI